MIQLRKVRPYWLLLSAAAAQGRRHHLTGRGRPVPGTNSYPTSFNAHDSLGDCYVEASEQALAMEAYRSALKIQEHADTRRKLNQLQEKE